MLKGTFLYRSILRAHLKYLPYPEMQQLGNKYVQTEFKLHKNTNNPQQIQQFYNEWNQYLQQIIQTGLGNEIIIHNTQSSDDDNDGRSDGIFQIGQDLPSNIQLSDEQIKQLEKLKEETFNINKH